jgi:SAM-dependent methyltransferase
MTVPHEYSNRYYDTIYTPRKDYAAEARRIHELIQQHGSPDARTLLDVACGTGMHLSFLRDQHGYEVEGLDIDPGMLTVAAQRLPGVSLHEADMAAFDLGREFDAVICLFSAIGYVRTVERLNGTLACFAAHVRPSGVVIVEPWLSVEAFKPDTVHGLFIDEPDLKLARINTSRVEGQLSIMEMHHLIGTPDGVEHFVEHLELAMFTHAQYVEAFQQAGLRVVHDQAGLDGRGLYIGVRDATG